MNPITIPALSAHPETPPAAGYYLYSIDRIVWQMDSTGAFRRVEGLGWVVYPVAEG